MNEPIIFPVESTPALTFAAKALRQRGMLLAAAPDKRVTHLLLPVPSFDADGSIRGGGRLEALLPLLSDGITVFGGGLGDLPCRTVDLLQDPAYLAENAAITAHCAVKRLLSNLPATVQGCSILVIGWGRIGKCLAQLLRDMGANVTVAARKETDRAMLRALGYATENPAVLRFSLVRYRVIFNTVPAMLLSSHQLSHCRPDCIKIDLASVRGMDAPDVICARGLPGTDAPETSGALIARTVIRLCNGGGAH